MKVGTVDFLLSWKNKTALKTDNLVQFGQMKLFYLPENHDHIYIIF